MLINFGDRTKSGTSGALLDVGGKKIKCWNHMREVGGK